MAYEGHTVHWSPVVLVSAMVRICLDVRDAHGMESCCRHTPGSSDESPLRIRWPSTADAKIKQLVIRSALNDDSNISFFPLLLLKAVYLALDVIADGPRGVWPCVSFVHCSAVQERQPSPPRKRSLRGLDSRHHRYAGSRDQMVRSGYEIIIRLEPGWLSFSLVHHHALPSTTLRFLRG